jgi:hypothetical protein
VNSTDNTVDYAQLLRSEAMAIRELNAAVIDATDIGTHAVEAAERHWKVIALNGKVPAVPNPHAEGTDERRTCKGECGHQGHGVHDATDDVDTVARRWGEEHRGRNIGVAVPPPMFVLDVDPRHGGDATLAALVSEHGRLPETLQQFSGRGDGGTHWLYRRPAGKLTGARLGRGLDLKASGGYVVWAPSIHPATGRPYTRIDRGVAEPPEWLADLIVVRERRSPAVAQIRPPWRQSWQSAGGSSIADEFSANTSWVEILDPHGWTCRDADPNADGARWLHPTHTSQCSATVRNGCLFVYSSNTPFDVTEAGSPHGYTKFRAHAVLDHRGDMSAAARAVRALRGGQVA